MYKCVPHVRTLYMHNSSCPITRRHHIVDGNVADCSPEHLSILMCVSATPEVRLRCDEHWLRCCLVAALAISLTAAMLRSPIRLPIFIASAQDPFPIVRLLPPRSWQRLLRGIRFSPSMPPILLPTIVLPRLLAPLPCRPSLRRP